MQKKTKIVCTIGPASLEPEVLDQMAAAGMNCARINTAYGDFDRYKTIVENVRQVADIPVLVDLKGPEIRLRTDHELVLKAGDTLDVGFNGEPVRFNHNFVDQMTVGDLVFVDNGRIKMTVTHKREGSLTLRSDSSGVISDGKGVNVPNKQLAVSTLSDRDRKLIDFAKEFDISYLALSFTRSAKDLGELRSAAQGYKGALVAKVENFDGIQNFDAILESADGVLIARGDLGVEIATERVPLVQKLLIRKCNQAGKTVITATEMLESMMVNPSPTRAEVSDVANAILDGTDATMLSGETAIGKYPTQSVEVMARVAKEAETAAVSSVEDRGFVNISDTVSRSIHRICKNMPLTKIVTLTRSGYTARMISRFKVPQPIIAVTYSPVSRRQLELVYGVIPVLIDYQKETDRILTVACNLYSNKLLDADDTVLFTAAFRTKQKHASNLIEIHQIKELLDLQSG